MSIRELSWDELRARSDIASEPLVALCADIAEDGGFSNSWLVISETEVCVLSADRAVARRLPVEQIADAALDRGVGGGAFIVHTADGPLVLVRFTSGLSAKFGYALTVLKALIKGEAAPRPSARDLPNVCPSCKRPLAEGTSVCPACQDRGKIIRRLASFARPYRGRLIAGFAVLLVTTALQLAPPYVTKILIDNVLVPRRGAGGFAAAAYLLSLVALLFGANLFGMLFQALRGFIGVWCGSRITGDIRRQTYDALMRLSLSYFDRRQTSQFIGRVNSDANSMREFMTDGIVFLASQVMTIAAIAIVMLELNWQLALLSFAAMPLIIATSLAVWPFIRNLWEKQWRSILRLNVLVGDSLQGVRVVKAFGQEAMERGRYQIANQDLVAQTTRIEGVWQGVFPLFTFLTGTGGLLVWYFGGLGVLHGAVTLGTLIAFNAYLGMFVGPLQWFSQFMNWLNH